jgi:hypothetical protein
MMMPTASSGLQNSQIRFCFEKRTGEARRIAANIAKLPELLDKWLRLKFRVMFPYIGYLFPNPREALYAGASAHMARLRALA